MPISHSNGRHLAIETAAAIAERHITTAGTRALFLPPERTLAEQYKVARTTVRRALALLTSRGFVVPEHGRGYRILARDPDGAANYRIAILQAAETSHRYHGRTSTHLVDALHRQSLRRKWQVLAMDVGDLSPAAVLRGLRDANVHAAALVIEDSGILRCLHRAGIPCVAIESTTRDLPIDYIYQDNFGGARMAARYLLDKGHKRIGWFGQVAETLTAFERFSGARSALVERGLDFNPADLTTGYKRMEEAALKLLSGHGHPEAVLTMWHGETMAVAQAAGRLGLLLGRDLDVVGWSTENRYRELAARQSAAARLPVVVWDSDQLAEVVTARLQLHRLEPELQPLHMAIPPRLVLVHGKDGEGDEKT